MKNYNSFLTNYNKYISRIYAIIINNNFLYELHKSTHFLKLYVKINIIINTIIFWLLLKIQTFLLNQNFIAML